MGTNTDHSSQWPEKLAEIKSILFKSLPLAVAAEMYDLYQAHVSARRGIPSPSREEQVYRKLLEFEESLLMWIEMKVRKRKVLSDSSSIVVFYRKRGRTRKWRRCCRRCARSSSRATKRSGSSRTRAN